MDMDVGGKGAKSLSLLWSNVAFYEQLKTAGINMTKEMSLLLTISAIGDEILDGSIDIPLTPDF